MVRVIYSEKIERFICFCSFDEREIPRKAGFLWNDTKNYWFTFSCRVALKLQDYFKNSAKEEINRVMLLKLPVECDSIPFPKKLKPLPFQLAATAFALERNRSYLALDPGLGKTIVASLIMNSLKAPVVYICPPFLVRNIQYEFEKWGLPKRDIHIWSKDSQNTFESVMIVPDSMLKSKELLASLNHFLDTFKTEKPILFIDEAHRFKSFEAARTRNLFGYRPKNENDFEETKGLTRLFNRVILLSGSPMPNRPMELYPVLNACAPEKIDFMYQHAYGIYFCNAKQDERGHWDYSGSSNMKELGERIKGGDFPFMLRLRKELLKLPPVLEEVVILEPLLPPTLLNMEKKLLEEHSPEDLMQSELGEEHISSYRRELGMHKAKDSIEYIKSILEETNDNVLIGVFHKSVAEAVTVALKEFNPLTISGNTPKDERFDIVNKYQSSKDHRVLVAQYLAGGIGFNITKANHVIFVEFSWTPSDNSQFIDRAHRYGQKDSVLVKYLVYKNSLDRPILETNLRKKQITGHI